MREFRDSLLRWSASNKMLCLYLLGITAWLFVVAPAFSDSICGSCGTIANDLPRAFAYFASVFWVAAYCLPMTLYRKRGSEREEKGAIGVNPKYYTLMVFGFFLLAMNVPSALEAIVLLWSVILLSVLPVVGSMTIYYLSDNLLAKVEHGVS